jgi:hypothetical protein
LATSLTNLGAHYGNLGRRQEALAPTEEALKIRRKLAKTNPSFLGDLASSLNNLGVSYTDLGRRQEALAPTEEAVKIRRELTKTNPAFLGDLAGSLNNLGVFKRDLGEPEQARAAFDESLTIIRPLAAANPAFQDDLQRFSNNLENLNRQEGLRTGERKLLAPTDLTFLPKDDPNTPLRRSVVRLWPTFAGQKPGVGQLGTGFVVKRQGDRAWIATALHVVRSSDDWRPAIQVEAELYSGSLPEGLVAPRLMVTPPPSQAAGEGGDDLIILELRGLPADVQPLPLTAAQPSGILKVVGHPTDKPPWTVATFPVLKSTERQLVLDGQLKPGASGSPVLTDTGLVLGLIYETSTYEKQDINFVFAYRSSAIQNKLP